MSKNMVTRLIEVMGTGNFDRPDLDDVRASEKAQFWRSVEAGYRIGDEEYSGLVADDLDFGGIDPGTIVPHSTAKLEELWKDLTSFSAFQRLNFVHPASTNVNLKNSLVIKLMCFTSKIRPEAPNCVRGGMYEEDEFDSHAPASATPTRVRRSATPSQQIGYNKRPLHSPNVKPTQNKKQKSKAEAINALVTLDARITAAREAEVAL
ncbi:hypothetical protein PHMEG_00026058 [Phytophthora megakarya]|uniref:Uncharacterized protein n=1 Tax=Phytophthora megakarya TaxID=4795 RepID=A0A225VD20_9STRA|nr:hypothetical protein PHMEG_00026058 [Phytophthora megakarya]